jgi:hypothetical protein
MREFVTGNELPPMERDGIERADAVPEGAGLAIWGASGV